ncbi:hypothetical protein TNCV_3829551 [Trichonephila clavipes]|nr:hypothetical protein TNCV_3829551 [Trichonephila clavipes]
MGSIPTGVNPFSRCENHCYACHMIKSHKKSICKEPLPAPGNRSNERRYKEKDLARTEEEKVGTGEREESGGEETRGGEK